MVKSVIKEIFIILLLIIAILLILGIMFYEYNPTSKKIPNKVAEYALPQEMEEELKETLEASETQNIVKTYRVEGSELKRSERLGNYKSGKENPFSKEVIQNNNNTADDNTNTNNNNAQGTGIQGNLFNTVK